MAWITLNRAMRTLESTMVPSAMAKPDDEAGQHRRPVERERQVQGVDLASGAEDLVGTPRDQPAERRSRGRRPSTLAGTA